MTDLVTIDHKALGSIGEIIEGHNFKMKKEILKFVIWYNLEF